MPPDLRVLEHEPVRQQGQEELRPAVLGSGEARRVGEHAHQEDEPVVAAQRGADRQHAEDGEQLGLREHPVRPAARGERVQGH